MELVTFALAVVALLVGLAIGWLTSRRTAAARGEGVAESLRLQLDGVREERDAARGEVEGLRDKLDEERQARGRLGAELSAEKAGHAERERGLQERLTELKTFNEESKKALTDQFDRLSRKALDDVNSKFLSQAEERLGMREQKSEAKLRELLQPVDRSLTQYRQRVEELEKNRTEAYGNLRSLIGEMKEGNQRVSSETARLVNSLRNAPKARGRWGEQQLKNVLESCGLTEHVDFVTEQSIATEEGGRLRPDAVIRTPGGRNLVVDAKVSLNDYQDAFEAVDEEGREAAMNRHCRSMKAHVEGLSKKAYWDQFDNAPDYVIMFVPGEHFLAAALEHDPGLWDLAFEKRVLLATPTNLVAIARTVAGVWRQEKMADEARVIGQLGKEMYDRLATASEHLKRVGAGLNSAVGNYNKFVGSFERNVLSTGRRFKELNIETGKKELEIVDEVEALPRYGSEETGEGGDPDPDVDHRRDAAE